MQVEGLLFDAYGTLFDVHSVVEAGRAVTDDPESLSALWRQKQLEYTWLRSLMGRYEDFWASPRRRSCSPAAGSGSPSMPRRGRASWRRISGSTPFPR